MLSQTDAPEWFIRHAGTLFANVIASTALALAYLYLLPAYTEKIYLHVLTKQRELKKLKLKANEQTPLSQVEAQQLHRDLAKIQNTKDNDAKRYREQTAALNLRIEELETSSQSEGESDQELQDENTNEVEKEFDLMKEALAFSEQAATKYMVGHTSEPAIDGSAPRLPSNQQLAAATSAKEAHDKVTGITALNDAYDQLIKDNLTKKTYQQLTGTTFAKEAYDQLIRATSAKGVYDQLKGDSAAEMDS